MARILEFGVVHWDGTQDLYHLVLILDAYDDWYLGANVLYSNVLSKVVLKNSFLISCKKL